jgi:CHAT domain-containing protein/tetratricopeptide (TPR) repeat protein
MEVMAIADRQAKIAFELLNWTTSRFIKAGLLTLFIFFSTAAGQTDGTLKDLAKAQLNFDNGKYQTAIDLAGSSIEKATKLKDDSKVLAGLNIVASSQISLGNFAGAQKSLDESLKLVSENKNADQKVLIYIRYAWLLRAQRKFPEAFEFSKKAVAAAPNNRQILAEHYLSVGRILFSSGYDISAIIWLEKAEKLLESDKNSSTKIDVYRFLTLAWYSKLNYQRALRYAEKCVSSAENTAFKYKHRQALFDQATVLSQSGQEKKAYLILEKGLKLSVDENDPYQGGKFLTSLLLNYLEDGDISKASGYLAGLEKPDTRDQFSFEIKLGKAVVFALQGQSEASEKLFVELEKQENTSDFILPYWKIAIAERNKDWNRLIQVNQSLFDLAIKNNYRDDLPVIYLNFARGYYYLNQPQKALENLDKLLAFAEDLRKSEDENLSLGLFETFHNAYRLFAQIKLDQTEESFELTDFLKARVLNDRINNAATKANSDISPEVRKKLEDLSLKYIGDNSLAGEIEKNEKLITTKIPELNLKKPDLSGLDKITSLNDSAIISYFFTLDKKLLAFVWEKGKSVQTTLLPISENEVELLTAQTQENIKNRIFFKRDGKAIFDKLLKPLALKSKHFIIIPDKSLWKLPFQALSSDGEKYLIEEKQISYAPSVSILLEQLNTPKPDRRSFQAFANSNFENKVLQYVNAEASTVGGIYNSKPVLNATSADFIKVSDKSDILHFSMHAEVENEQPLDSFMGFRKFGNDDGRLTVEELLKIKLKKGSMVFLASCDTNNVLNGEGLVSIAWGMLASGATTVISAQWEANDKSTAIFTSNFYKSYQQGISAVEAMQKASLELIKDKSSKMHEPYYWADFTLNGDFR